MDSASKLTFRYDDLLGIIVWIQSVGEVKPEEHAAAMKFFGTHNPQPIALFKTSPKRIQVGIAKINKPKEQFVDSALKAATRQAQKLEPCVLVVQHGSLQTDDPSTNQAYMIGSFFRGPKTTVVVPQPGTQIVLER
ncbi:MAG: hypothetical protein E3J81_06340 [Dehalococcoidia bacterium]|nr:MAG: hypothetical protein E3J81_06340 [Dehalococcoidia bacterium]